MTTYRRRPAEVQVLRENGDGTITLRDTVTGETTNVKQSIFAALYEEVVPPPPLHAPGFLGETDGDSA